MSNSDFHTHTNHSDGKLSPTELVKWAAENDIQILAITDHDRVSAIEEAKIAGKALDVEIVAGVELSAEFDGRSVHILGYHIDIGNRELLEYCDRALRARESRNVKLISQLEKTYPRIREWLSQHVVTAGVRYVGKPIIAGMLVEKGFFSDKDEVFEKLFKREEYENIRKEGADYEEAIRAIKAAGGISVWAHPGKTKLKETVSTGEKWSELFEIAKQMKSAGLSGIECIHPEHSRQDMLSAVEIAEKLKLHITAGSDYHGD